MIKYAVTISGHNNIERSEAGACIDHRLGLKFADCANPTFSRDAIFIFIELAKYRCVSTWCNNNHTVIGVYIPTLFGIYRAGKSSQCN